MPSGTLQRPYRDDADYWRLRRFLQTGWRLTESDGSLFHVGDLTWQRFMFTRDVMPPEERIRLWERPDGELAGFAWYYPKHHEATFQLDPAMRGSEDWRAIVAEMLAFADERHGADPDATAVPLTVAAPESDPAFIALLGELGFVQSDDPAMRFHRQSLDKALPTIHLPDGFTVRAVQEHELTDRVEAHRDVWAPSKITLESYKQLRASPGYNPELDIVAVAPDGGIAAYAICWHDEIDRSGEFEPVGAREAFRGRGLTKAVLLEAMHRLQALGCETAYVFTTEDRVPAVNLYRSAGFDLVNRWHSYRRSIG
ncbi:MAG: GNAT family N-acetyltransferase [Thermomicrobiales bacterium]|nr:GNAT family N-acetyltransferase [Thermomicrobiales bacterium]